MIVNQNVYEAIVLTEIATHILLDTTQYANRDRDLIVILAQIQNQHQKIEPKSSGF